MAVFADDGVEFGIGVKVTASIEDEVREAFESVSDEYAEYADDPNDVTGRALAHALDWYDNVCDSTEAGELRDAVADDIDGLLDRSIYDTVHDLIHEAASERAVPNVMAFAMHHADEINRWADMNAHRQ